MKLNDIFPEADFSIVIGGSPTIFEYEIDNNTLDIFLQHELPKILKGDFEEKVFFNKIVDAMVLSLQGSAQNWIVRRDPRDGGEDKLYEY